MSISFEKEEESQRITKARAHMEARASLQQLHSIEALGKQFSSVDSPQK